MRVIRLLFAAALLTGTWIGVSAADELKVLSTDAMKPALQELAPAFEAASKHKLVIAFASDADVEKQVASDDSIDIAILTKARMDKLIRSARILTPPASKVLAQGASEDLVYVAGSSMATEQPLAARALVEFLAGPEAKKVYAAKGLKTS
jgi:ABC-type molybdate transport system substrate-binding protein